MPEPIKSLDLAMKILKRRRDTKPPPPHSDVETELASSDIEPDDLRDLDLGDDDDDFAALEVAPGEDLSLGEALPPRPDPSRNRLDFLRSYATHRSVRRN